MNRILPEAEEILKEAEQLNPGADIDRLHEKTFKLRERGTRGLAFDGDSMIGFFNQPSEFTESNIKVIDEHCKHTGGYCYVPEDTLRQIKHKTKRFRPNTEFARDMENFTKTGSI